MDDSITELLASMSNMSLNNNSIEVKLKARDILRKMSNTKLDQLIDIVSEIQKNNAKTDLKTLYHNTCNNVLFMIIEVKKERIDI